MAPSLTGRGWGRVVCGQRETQPVGRVVFASPHKSPSPTVWGLWGDADADDGLRAAGFRGGREAADVTVRVARWRGGCRHPRAAMARAVTGQAGRVTVRSAGAGLALARALLPLVRSRSCRSATTGGKRSAQMARGQLLRQGWKPARGETGAAWLDAQHESPARSEAQGDAQEERLIARQPTDHQLGVIRKKISACAQKPQS